MRAESSLPYDPSDRQSIEAYAKRLQGLTFRDVLDLGILPPGMGSEEAAKAYWRKSYKGGMGNLLEERYFGYRANSDSEADFARVGVELKATCYDTLKDGNISAGERLVLTMIPNDAPVAPELGSSHLWDKCRNLLLVYYGRDRGIPSYDQRIRYVGLFTPPAEDLKVISEDYRSIARLVMTGCADELSESLTSYLGACTKGANREKSTKPQYYYAPDKLARRRAFCYKRPYMDYVLHHYLMGAVRSESLGVAGSQLKTFCEEVINMHAGETDASLCLTLGLEYTGNKAQWSTIAYRLLGVRGDKADEFEKAGVVVRAIREEGDGRIRESVPFPPFRFAALAVEDEWEDSQLKEYVESTTFLFVVFRKQDDGTSVLMGCTMWHMPEADVDGPLQRCWRETVTALHRGVHIVRRGGRFINDLPKMSDNPVAHVRPHSTQSAYRLEGTEVGNVSRDGDELPDGRWMTRQSFWLNHDYIARVLHEVGL